jgi:hypothetical protein
VNTPSAQEAKVSIGETVGFNKQNTIRLADVYTHIQKPIGDWKQVFAELRDLVDNGDLDEYNRKKKNLRVFTWSGTFDNRSNDGLIQHTGRLQIDIDWKDKPRAASEELRDQLGEDTHIEFACLSPSARGVKCGMLIPVCANDAEHKKAFAAAENYFKQQHSITIDSSCKDVSRICFFSYDPHRKLNESATPLDITRWATVAPNHSDTPSTTKTESPNHPAGGEGKTFDKLTPELAQQLLDHIAGYDNRDTWIKVGHALKHAFGDDGLPLWEGWSAKSAKWQESDREKWDGFKPTNTNGEATLIAMAREGGWQYQSPKKLPSAPAKKDNSAKVTKGNYHIRITKDGKELHEPNQHNVREYLKVIQFPAWYDSFLNKIFYHREGEGIVEWSDLLTLRLQGILQDQFDGMRRLSKEVVNDAVIRYSNDKVKNCLTDWLDSLKWDDKPRLDTWLHEYLGAENNTYIREVGRCWLLGAVARAYQPGIKFDWMLVLEGPQGVGKSTALQVLSNGWFDTVTSFNGKDPLDKIQGRWIIEIEELDAFNKSEVDSIKSFLTNTNDRYRPAYGHFTVDHPRTCVFAGTTNKNEYLRDETGNRRFWPIQCGQIKNEMLRKDLNQLWAETVTRFKKDEAFFINEDARVTAIEMQDSRYQGDAWDEVISAYIEEKSAVTYDQIFDSVLYIDLNLRDQRSRLRIGKIMRRLGWDYLQVRVGKSKSRKWVKGK